MTSPLDPVAMEAPRIPIELEAMKEMANEFGRLDTDMGDYMRLQLALRWYLDHAPNLRALNATRPTETEVGVKKLAWRFFDVGHEYGRGVWDANSILGTYTIEDMAGHKYAEAGRYICRDKLNYAQNDDLDALTAAAQAHHDSCIRSALVQSSPARDARPGETRERWQANLENAWAAIRMIREAVEEFGAVAELGSEEATLALLGPEPVHEAQMIVEALGRVRAALPHEVPHD